MLKQLRQQSSSKQFNQNLKEGINNKIILNPMQLFVKQLQVKQNKSKKSSIQNVHVIALCMKENQIVEELMPLLIKCLIEENAKDIKILIIKSFKKLVQMLKKQSSFLRILQIIFDILIVFDQNQIRTQTVLVLNYILFQQKLLYFSKFKPSFKKLIQQLATSSDIKQRKNGKELSLILCKYFLNNSSQLTSNQILQILQFLKNQFFLKNDEEYASLKILSQKFYLLVQEWPKDIQKQLIFFLNIFTNFDQQQNKINQEQLVQQQEIKKQNTKISNKQIPKEVTTQLRCNVISSILIFSQKFNYKLGELYLENLMKQQQQKIKIALIKNSKSIFKIFHSQSLQPIKNMFRNFSQQNQQIKKIILQIVDQIQFENLLQKDNLLKGCKNSIEIKNICIQYLIRSNQSQTIRQMLSQSDYDFKVKIFTKLPNSIFHQNKAYGTIFESLILQPKKNFRTKLNIIQNLISRIEQVYIKKTNLNQQIAHSFQISYIIPSLSKLFCDKIAILRVNSAKLCSLILKFNKYQFLVIKNIIEQSFYGDNKNWLERQNILIVIKQFLEIDQSFKYYVNQSKLNQEKEKLISCMKKLLKDALKGIPVKNKQRQEQDRKKKMLIKNITNLAENILKKYKF